jgi:hypothetical protein
VATTLTVVVVMLVLVSPVGVTVAVRVGEKNTKVWQLPTHLVLETFLLMLASPVTLAISTLLIAW